MSNKANQSKQTKAFGVISLVSLVLAVLFAVILSTVGIPYPLTYFAIAFLFVGIVFYVLYQHGKKLDAQPEQKTVRINRFRIAAIILWPVAVTFPGIIAGFGFPISLLLVELVIIIATVVATVLYFLNKDNDKMPELKPDTGNVSINPLKIVNDSVYINQKDFEMWRKYSNNAVFEKTAVVKLTSRAPVIKLHEGIRQVREYHLQPEKDENFTGKYFLMSARCYYQGQPEVPVVLIDGFISDTPEERAMTTDDIGYRMEVYIASFGGYDSLDRYTAMRGQDLPMKALKYPGLTTPANIRLIGICPYCHNSFAFHAYAVYMIQNDVAYSDDGLFSCQIVGPVDNKETWKYEEDGLVFRYYNSFCCPHCAQPYIDYRKFPQNKKFGVSCCVHLTRKCYTSE